MELQEIELFIKDEQNDGVFAVSLVGDPAIEENFVALSQYKVNLKVVDEEKRVVVGYALVPEKRIYRKMTPKGHDEPVEFNIYFKDHTIEKTQELYMKNLNLNNWTSEHEKPVQGVNVVESWITEDEDNDKISLYGIKPIKGGWALKAKIHNDDEWEKVKDGEYMGFSIEGIFQGFENLKFSKEEELDIIKELENIINGGK